MPLAPDRFETHRAMLLGGLRRYHTYADSERTIPEQWHAFESMLDLPGRRGPYTYGAVCGNYPDQQRFEYMAAVEVADLTALPEGTGKMRVPEAYYAVFKHMEPISTIRQTWDAIWQEWYPASGFTFAPVPDFERYGPAFDPATGLGGLEIWFPIHRPA